MMKKSMILALVLAAVVGASAASLSYACDMMGSGKDGKGMMDKKGMMSGMMEKGMMGKTVTPTSDGGVVVLAGNQLFKYDKSLKLVNKAEVPVDMDMMKMCPMSKGGAMGSGGSSDTASTDSQSAGAASSDATDHAAHH